MTSGMSRAFTLIELMISVSILGIVVLAVMPSFTTDAPLKLIATANIVTSDIEYAQALTLADPSDPVIVRIDPEAEQYWLALTSDPETPIPRPESLDEESEYVIQFGDNAEDTLQGVSITAVDFDTENTLAFDAFGRLEQLEDLAFKLTNESGDLYVVVTASTGSVSISNDAPGE